MQMLADFTALQASLNHLATICGEAAVINAQHQFTPDSNESSLWSAANNDTSTATAPVPGYCSRRRKRVSDLQGKAWLEWWGDGESDLVRSATSTRYKHSV